MCATHKSSVNDALVSSIYSNFQLHVKISSRMKNKMKWKYFITKMYTLILIYLVLAWLYPSKLEDIISITLKLLLHMSYITPEVHVIRNIVLNWRCDIKYVGSCSEWNILSLFTFLHMLINIDKNISYNDDRTVNDKLHWTTYFKIVFSVNMVIWHY